jgi:hypothetical protein
MSTANDPLFDRASFFTPLPDASKSFLFFPMVTRRHVVLVVEVAVVWAMAETMSVAF